MNKAEHIKNKQCMNCDVKTDWICGECGLPTCSEHLHRSRHSEDQMDVCSLCLEKIANKLLSEEFGDMIKEYTDFMAKAPKYANGLSFIPKRDPCWVTTRTGRITISDPWFSHDRKSWITFGDWLEIPKNIELVSVFYPSREAAEAAKGK